VCTWSGTELSVSVLQDAVKVMAKSLIRNRHAVTKLHALKSQLQAVSLRIQVRRPDLLHRAGETPPAYLHDLSLHLVFLYLLESQLSLLPCMLAPNMPCLEVPPATPQSTPNPHTQLVCRVAAVSLAVRLLLPMSLTPDVCRCCHCRR
jgi:hypothetical protein